MNTGPPTSRATPSVIARTVRSRNRSGKFGSQSIGGSNRAEPELLRRVVGQGQSLRLISRRSLFANNWRGAPR